LDARNVSDLERLGSLVAGGGLFYDGLRRRSPWRMLLGGGLLVRGATGRSLVYRAFGLSTAEALHYSRAAGVLAGHGYRIDERITILRAPSDVFEFWRHFENLPNFMRHLKSVTPVGISRTHWVARGPLGRTIEWDAEIVNERADELIAWRSIPGGDLDTAGSIHFAPTADGFGTELHLEMKYDAPGGRWGAALAWLLGNDPRRSVRDDLAHLKRLLDGVEPSTPRFDVRKPK
jgi:uncharacterized membrane protein